MRVKCSVTMDVKKETHQYLLWWSCGTTYHWHVRTNYCQKLSSFRNWRDKRGECVPLHLQEKRTIRRACLAAFSGTVTVWPSTTASGWITSFFTSAFGDVMSHHHLFPVQSYTSTYVLNRLYKTQHFCISTPSNEHDQTALNVYNVHNQHLKYIVYTSLGWSYFRACMLKDCRCLINMPHAYL